MNLTTVAEANRLVAANVRAEAARARCRQSDLAPVLGVSRAQMSQRLSGRVALTVGELVTISSVLGVPLALLLDGVEQATTPDAQEVPA